MELRCFDQVNLPSVCRSEPDAFCILFKQTIPYALIYPLYISMYQMLHLYLNCNGEVPFLTLKKYCWSKTTLFSHIRLHFPD